jgi:flagellar secretion chaperone FliS
MAASTGYDMYRNSHFKGMDPKNLILMLYDGAIKHIRLAKEGIKENNIPKRGENLGRAISIISELNASLDPNIRDDAIDFLRGLYAAILVELPKVSISNDIEILRRAETYMDQLRNIWKTTVMAKPENKNPDKDKPEVSSSLYDASMPIQKTGYGPSVSTHETGKSIRT